MNAVQKYELIRPILKSEKSPKQVSEDGRYDGTSLSKQVTGELRETESAHA